MILSPFCRHAGLTAMLTLISLIGATQVVVDNTIPAADAVQNVLLGNGITASNITFSGDGNQIGTFDCVDCNVGLPFGVILGSGDVTAAVGPNNSSSFTLGGGNWGVTDADLQILNPGLNFNDAVVLEFDFDAAGDSIQFNFVWASEEYPEFSGSGYNDSFGFFVSGPGFNGPYSNNAENIALIPGTTLPVTINNVNNGTSGTTGPCSNCEYYIHNPPGTDATSIQYDGFTTVLTAEAAVQCGETYHIKIAVADAGDTGYDSAVFLEAGSFTSNQIEVDFQTLNIAVDDSTLYEGCGQANIIFSRPPGNTLEQSFMLNVLGTATNGVDYPLIPDSLTFLENEFEIVLDFYAFQDALTEGTESVVLSYTNFESCNVIAEPTEFTFYIGEPDPIFLDFIEPTINCNEDASIEVTPSGGFGAYEANWNTGNTGFSLVVSPSTTTTYTLTVTDTCGLDPAIQDLTVTIPDYPPLVVDVGADQELYCTDNLIVNPTVGGGYGNYNYTWFVGSQFGGNDLILDFAINEEVEVTLLVGDDCGTTSSDALLVTFPPVDISVSAGPDLEVTCLDTPLLTANVVGGIAPLDFQWSSDGNFLGNQNSLNITDPQSETIVITVTDLCGNTATDQVVITLPPVEILVDLGNDLEVTCLDNTTLSPDISGGIGNYSYSWFSNGTPVGNLPDYTVQTFSDVSVTLEVLGACGNSASDVVELFVPEIPVQIDLGNDLNISCLDTPFLEPTVTGGVGNYIYSWVNNEEVVGNGPNYSAPFIGQTTYLLTVVDACQNSATDEINLNVPPLPISVDLGGDLLATCVDETVLSPTTTGGVGAYSYYWELEGVPMGNDNTISVIINQPSQAVVVVEDACGNSGADEINLDLMASPIEAQILSPDAICLGDNLQLIGNATGGAGILTYYWVTTDEYGQTSWVSPEESSVFVLDVFDQCGNSTQISNWIGVEEVVANFDFNYVGEMGLELINNSVNGDSFLWDFGNDETSNEENPTYSYTDLQNHPVILYTIGAMGCVDSIVHEFIPFMDLFVPNSFTPNNDGVNDFFRVEGHDVYSFDLWIYNRWGELVFHTSKLDEVWDGSMKGGDFYVKDDVYQYILKAVGIRENGIEKTGTITLYR